MYKNDVTVELGLHLLFQAGISFRISELFIFWTDLAKIWSKE